MKFNKVELQTRYIREKRIFSKNVGKLAQTFYFLETCQVFSTEFREDTEKPSIIDKKSETHYNFLSQREFFGVNAGDF
ncbi:hypothetical protein QUF82_06030 [Thiotrichales bacterium HSG14]|nr:hypothetical protein [Thiotrichales bacterium HSG14]